MTEAVVSLPAPMVNMGFAEAYMIGLAGCPGGQKLPGKPTHTHTQKNPPIY